MFSAIAIDHVQSPRNRGPLQGATHVGTGGSPGEGPYARLWLIVEDGRIVDASYKTPGCPSSTACASVLCQLISGRDVQLCRMLTNADLLAVVGGLPEGKDYWIDHVMAALNDALNCHENPTKDSSELE